MSEHDYPWRDETLLREKYVAQDKSSRKIADEWGAGKTTILKWLEKYSIPKQSKNGSGDANYRDNSWLREKYISEGLSTREIAEICDTGKTTIETWLGKHDITPRDRLKASIDARRVEYVSYRTSQGYERWDNGDTTFNVHRLIAVAEYGIDAVKDMDVHHINGITWDNRPENITLLQASEHGKLHEQEMERRNGGEFNGKRKRECIQ